MRRPLLPPSYFLIALIAMVSVHLITPTTLWNPWPWGVVGVVPISIGLALTITASRQFQKAETTIYPFDSPSRLVTDGVFRWSRNPMYLGMVLILSGIAIGLGSVSALPVPALFLVLIHRRFIRHEERALEQRFGPAYHEYSRNVRRWL